MKTVIQIVLWIVCIFLGYLIYQSVNAPIEFNKVRKERFSEVIAKLKDIRDSQEAYKSVNGRYAGNFNSLIQFVDTGNYTITQQRDSSFMKYDKVYQIELQKDTIIIDTLGFVQVKDSLFKNDDRYKSLMDVPGAANGEKFEMKGKQSNKKSLALQAVSYGNVYVAQIAIGAKDNQTLKAIQEAEAYPGPSIIIAYSHCGEHGYDLKDGAAHQAKAVETGYWPLFRFNPLEAKGKKFRLDSKAPAAPLEEFMYSETRFTRVVKENSEMAKDLLDRAQEQVDIQWERLELYKNL